jgi:hypothetical protein
MTGSHDRISILLVEDSREMRDTIKSSLRGLEASFFERDDGVQALTAYGRDSHLNAECDCPAGANSGKPVREGCGGRILQGPPFTFISNRCKDRSTYSFC